MQPGPTAETVTWENCLKASATMMEGSDIEQHGALALFLLVLWPGRVSVTNGAVITAVRPSNSSEVGVPLSTIHFSLFAAETDKVRVI